MTKAQERAYQASKAREKIARELMYHAIANKGYSVKELFNAFITAGEDAAKEIAFEFAEDNQPGQWVTTHNIKQEAALAEFLQTLHNIY